MSHREWGDRTPPISTSYLERLSRRLPRICSWSGSKEKVLWPDSAKLVISVSLHWETVTENDIQAIGSAPDSAHRRERYWEAWHEYGIKEGIPRLLEIFTRRHIRVTCAMTGTAADQYPALAEEVVERGHEAAIQARNGLAPCSLNMEEERRRYEADIQSIVQATGTRPVGFDAFWPLRPPSHLEIFRELGFVYQMGAVSRDEPFLVMTAAKPFVVVPNGLNMHEDFLHPSALSNSDPVATELRNQFEMLYTESESRRRLMSISLQDWVSGRPAPAKVMEEFIIYAQRRPGVVFMRKDEIARFALNSAITPREQEPAKGQEAA